MDLVETQSAHQPKALVELFFDNWKSIFFFNLLLVMSLRKMKISTDLYTLLIPSVLHNHERLHISFQCLGYSKVLPNCNFVTILCHV